MLRASKKHGLSLSDFLLPTLHRSCTGGGFHSTVTPQGIFGTALLAKWDLLHGWNTALTAGREWIWRELMAEYIERERLIREALLMAEYARRRL